MINHHPDVVDYPTIEYDIKKNLKLFNDLVDDVDKLANSFRHDVMFVSTIIPIVCLTIEAILGKLRVPLRQISVNILG